MKLQAIVNKALKTNPAPELLTLCGEWYSPYYNLMYLLSAQLKNGFCVELGVHKGRGLAALAMANPTNLVIGFDNTYWADEIEAIRIKWPNTLFFQKSALPVPIDVTRPIHLLHIDTEHSYANAKQEFEAYKPYLAKGAYVLFDDLHAMEDGVMRAFKELPYEKVEDDRLHPSCGYGVLVYE